MERFPGMSKVWSKNNSFPAFDTASIGCSQVGDKQPTPTALLSEDHPVPDIEEKLRDWIDASLDELDPAYYAWSVARAVISSVRRSGTCSCSIRRAWRL
jgi:hypothetical protein